MINHKYKFHFLMINLQNNKSSLLLYLYETRYYFISNVCVFCIVVEKLVFLSHGETCAREKQFSPEKLATINCKRRAMPPYIY